MERKKSRGRECASDNKEQGLCYGVPRRKFTFGRVWGWGRGECKWAGWHWAKGMAGGVRGLWEQSEESAGGRHCECREHLEWYQQCQYCWSCRLGAFWASMSELVARVGLSVLRRWMDSEENRDNSWGSTLSLILQVMQMPPILWWGCSLINPW